MKRTNCFMVGYSTACLRYGLYPLALGVALGCGTSQPEVFEPGCVKDTECKGDRVCEQGRCISLGTSASQARGGVTDSGADAESFDGNTTDDSTDDPTDNERKRSEEAEANNSEAGAEVQVARGPCQGSDACSEGSVCIFVDADEGRCSEPSAQDCATAADRADGGAPACANGVGFAFHASEDAPNSASCSIGADCSTRYGNVHGTCIDAEGDGSQRVCAPLCEYQDDPEAMACVTDPNVQLVQCSRDHKRLATALLLTAECVDGGDYESWSCETSSLELDPDAEWAVDCVLTDMDDGRVDCVEMLVGQSGCFEGNPDAPLSYSEFIDVVVENLAFHRSESTSTVTTEQVCRTDCDCPRCFSCSSDKERCTYKGEGPYGCYGGCPY